MSDDGQIAEMTAATFIALPYSPWSEKARWALDWEAVPYHETAYFPMLGEPWLRWKIRRFSGQVSVPVLLAGDEILTDSFDIAKWADRAGQRASALFPSSHRVDIEGWNQRSETVLQCARWLAVSRVSDDPAALGESVPPMVPSALRSWIGSIGLRYLQHKYALDTTDEGEIRQRIERELMTLREALGSRDTLYADFSYADIAMACSLQLIEPVGQQYIPLGVASRRGLTDPDLRDSFSDVMAWRNALYASYR